MKHFTSLLLALLLPSMAFAASSPPLYRFQTPLSITNGLVSMTPASVSDAGYLTTGVQSLAGAKTWTGAAQFDAAVNGNVSFAAPFFKSSASNTAASSTFRTPNGGGLAMRNFANSADLVITTDASNNLLYNGAIVASSAGIVPVASGGTGISSYTTGDMLYATGATTLSKLAIGAANTVQVSTGTAPSWAQIVNANVSASAAIASTKLAATTASRALVSDGSGFFTASSATATQVALLDIASGRTGTGNLVFSASPTFTGTVSVGDIDATSISETGTEATVGFIRQTNNNSGVMWRNAGNSANLGIWVDGSNNMRLSSGVGFVSDGGSAGITGFTTGNFTTSLTSAAFISSTANPASSDRIRLANNEGVNWRNAGNSANFGMYLNPSNLFYFEAGLSVVGTAVFSGLDANKVVYADGSKQLQSATTTLTQVNYLGAATGTTGTTSSNLVFSASPTLTGTATIGNIIVGGLSASLPVFTNGSNQLVSNTMTGTGSVVMSASPTLSGTVTLPSGSVTSSAWSTGASTLAIGGTTTAVAINMSGNLTTTNASTDNTLAITGNAGAHVTTTTTGEYKWSAGRWVAANSYTITPSTAINGNTFSNPVFRAVASTGAMEIGNATLGGTVTVLTPLVGNSTITAGNSATVVIAPTTQSVTYTGAPASGKYNWREGQHLLNNNRYEFIPSTAADGSTFSTYALGIDRSFLLVQAPSGSNAGSIQLRQQAASGFYNFLVSGGYNANNRFEITPSTAADGSTFTNSVFQAIANTGAVTVGNATLGGAVTIPVALGVSGQTTITTSSGPQLIIKDGGSFGVNADPYITFHDNAGSGAELGFSAAAENNFYIKNIRAGILYFGTNNTFYGNISSAGLWTLGASSGTQTHVANGQLSIVGASSSGPTLEVNRGVAGGPSGRGTLRLTDISTDATVKQMSISFPNTTNSEEDHAVVYASGFTRSTLYWGGGVSTLNAVQEHQWFTAANETTTTGTLQGKLTQGLWCMGAACTTNTDTVLTISGISPVSGAATNGIRIDPTVSSGVTGGATMLSVQGTSQNSVFTTPYVLKIFPQPFTKGASHTITRLIGIYGTDDTAGTNNAFLANNLSFTGNYFINYNGSAASSIGGTVTFTSRIQTGGANPGTGGGLGIPNNTGITWRRADNGANYEYYVDSSNVFQMPSPGNFMTGYLTLGGNTTGDSNLGTITSVQNSSYYVGTSAATFVGAFTSGQAKTINYNKVGRTVTLNIPTTSAACSVATTISNVGTELPSGLRPAASTKWAVNGVFDNSGADINTALQIDTAGLITVYATAAGGSFTASGTCGWDRSISVTYYSNN